ncbi:UDP-Glycosyltransferase/glycogen phosphorylase [Testicularia cyperi]|uniref:Alpha-1,3/1,6-mannosyltransferase ALG2 n=1 Tax=Testicularia cyperi TaxID=1882483 RepID=A0A317XV62_9BASI|nr:UDP-Glycosyltransferase/glycogen phosphorylase [Testicularia cyperi]
MSLDRQSAAVANSVHSPQKKLRIGFIHPDLGIGGAEKLIVDAALSLQSLGHEVTIYTSHHDPKHCFEPTRDGTLKVQVMKTAIPRAFLGGFHLPCAILQQMSLVFQLMLAILVFKYPGTMPGFLSRRLTSAPPTPAYDLFFFDQLPAGIPWLKILLTTRIVYYCHFPDKDIGNSIAMQRAIARGQSGPSVFRKLYRLPLNLFEEGTTDYADKILVNSEFTSAQFVKSFFRLRRQPRVVYPGVDVSQFEPSRVSASVSKLDAAATAADESVQKAIVKVCRDEERTTLLSINRFEAKKNVALALEAFAAAQKEAAAQGGQRMRLILVGGYDKRVSDNVETLRELQKQADDLGLQHVTLSYNRQAYEAAVSTPRSEQIGGASVIFLLSLPMPLIHTLLLNSTTKALLYTPTDEHFGIVPCEAMACGVPVLATNTGGPTETVVDLALDGEGRPTNLSEGTGLLRHPSASIWGFSISALLSLSPEERETIAQTARQRVRSKFSTDVMSLALEKACYDAYAIGPVRGEEGLYQWGSTIGIFIVMSALFWVNVYFSQEKTLAEEAAKLAQKKDEWFNEWSQGQNSAATAVSADAVSGAPPPSPL